jgi:hypothetical protein
VAKSDKTERRAAVDLIRQQQKRADKRQGAIIVGVCVAVALLIIGLAAYRPIKDWWDLRQFKDLGLDSIGAPATVCGDITTKKSSGTQEHVAAGTPIDYPDAPPAFGEHEEYPDEMTRKLYTESDRPNVEKLVHNMEHGYTILWYDESIADDSDQMLLLKGIADKMKGTGNMRLKFKAVPWLAEDGKPFPDDQHVAFTHWAKESEEKGAKDDESVGVWQYCSEVSGEALNDFMLDYDYTNSPEPNGG